MSVDEVRGRFLWYDLMTTDMNAAAEFYGKVTGWDVQVHGSAGTYRMIHRGRTPIGGMMALPEPAKKMGAPPNWVAYVGTPDVDAAVRQATAAGATTFVPPSDIPSIGRFSIIADPQGATIALFQAGQPQPPSHVPEVGDFSWHELATTDTDAALSFYGDLVGWKNTENHDMGPMGVYRMFGFDGVTLGGLFNKPPQMPAPPHWLFYVRVPDINKGADLVKQHGGKVLIGPHEVPGGDWILQCLDPQGAAFALHQRKA
jgi:uncharacterized protein